MHTIYNEEVPTGTGNGFGSTRTEPGSTGHGFGATDE